MGAGLIAPVMAASLSDADRGKLIKVLGLLGSPVAGERDAAVHAAVRLLRDRQLDWSDVIAPPAAPMRPEQRAQPSAERTWSPRPAPSVWQMDVGACLRHPEILSEWERRFLVGLRGRPSLSAKQWSILHEVVAKVRARGGEVP